MKNSNLDGWFDAIEKCGANRRERNQLTREKINERGEPGAEVVIDSESNTKLKMWKIEDGITVITFRNEIADVYSITQYDDEFIDALIKCRAQKVG